MEKLIVGSGGGGGGSSQTTVTATEYPDTLSSKSYIKAIDLLGEGEFEEVLVGGLTGLYLDDIPVQNKDGSYNFTGINVETRNGSLSQTRMNIGGTTESSESVGIELRYNTPIEYTVTAQEADVVRTNIKVPALTSTDKSNGNISGTTVEYQIQWMASDQTAFNTVPDGTYISYNTVIASDINPAVISGYATYSYVVSVNSWTYRTGVWRHKQYFDGSSVYVLQTNVNNSGWVTIETAEFVGSLVLNKNISAQPGDIIQIQVLTYDTNIPSGSYFKETDSAGVISSVNAQYSTPTGIQKISGKTSSEYERQTSFRIWGKAPWIIRVTRLTPDSTSSYLQNKTFFSSVTTVLEEKLRYPGSVLVGGVYDAEQFSAIPSRSFLCKCLKVKVPTNYNPITRYYSGPWDGSFKVAWTDNPAWCFYDLLTNTRYGLGDRIPESFIDKSELYSIGQYCDELVPGYGGLMEPRFTCNIVIQTKEEAYTVIKDFASIFRGMTYWATGAVVPIQDRPEGVSYAFNNTNVVDGVFTYQSSALGTRYNAVSVTWNNPANFYKREVEYVEDSDLVNKLGYVNDTSVVGFGCASRGMARRVGRWLIYTNNYQTDIVTFSTGAEGAIPRPGDVIKISDTLRSQDRRGGRIVSSTLNGCTLDKPMLFVVGTNYTFSAINIDGDMVETTFTASGSTNVITFSSALVKDLAEDSIYIISDNNIEPEQFKVVSVTDKGDATYEVNALSYNPSKYAYVENDIPVVEFKLPSASVYPVTAIKYSEYLYADGTSVKNKCDLSWEAPRFAASYIVRVRFPDGAVLNETTSQPNYSIQNATEGSYVVSITAVNIIKQQAQSFEQSITLYGKTKVPQTVPNFSVNAVSGRAYLSWDTHPDLDVVVGGFIHITHTPKTSGASWSDGVTVEIVSGSNNSAMVPLMGGTYMAKAIDSSGFYSKNAAFALAEYALIQNKNVIDTMEESPDWEGAKTNLRKEGTSLTLDFNIYLDSVVDIDSVSDFDFLGGSIYMSGEYDFNRVVDLGASYNVNISASVRARSTELHTLFDARADSIDDWQDFDSFISNTFMLKTMISTTNDDPEGASPIWSDWSDFKIATYSARAFKFKLHVETISDSYAVFIDEASVAVDVDDRTVGENDIACPSTGLNLVFAPAFMTTPAISVGINDMQEGDYYEISNKTASGFSVVVKNAGIAVNRVIDYIAKGYGYKT